MKKWEIDLLGYLGGALLAICLLPQLYRTYKTRSAGDFSYIWNVLYMAGMIITIVYLIEVKALAGWISLVCEFAMALALFIMKAYLQFHTKKSEKQSKPSISVISDGDIELVKVIPNSPTKKRNI
ncbi:unnamed protein product [Didymodactylos carnosus]|uniref:PQ-loop repeat-containing protein n=1 Tax=Didymodactylos carnosus TaxID=1234261 RepID=A0A815P5U6_9BILA|nr:unnamed protein product [Didymodactylos carnosus]CAF1444603.1 unnamed protein product [Didymodactylos carnosus]CAF4087664.1 unnamed protein product [Didymodactylos carnosus]CAF4319657.1 unnamed protein product [Didymodactylos carnosus]